MKPVDAFLISGLIWNLPSQINLHLYLFSKILVQWPIRLVVCRLSNTDRFAELSTNKSKHFFGVFFAVRNDGEENEI